MESQVVEQGQKRPVRISMRQLMGTAQNPYMKYFTKPVLVNFMAEWEKHGLNAKL
jgi:hypothetical protein